MTLDGKVILVAGVGDGLGREVARLALRDGAQVVVAARSAEKLEAIAHLLAVVQLYFQFLIICLQMLSKIQKLICFDEKFRISAMFTENIKIPKFFIVPENSQNMFMIWSEDGFRKVRNKFEKVRNNFEKNSF